MTLLLADRMEEQEATTSASSRRHLLRGATSALVLAAAGLYLPGAIGTAEAREGSYGGQLGGRRGKDRRGRERRRTPGDRKDKRENPPRSSSGGRDYGVRVYVLNYRNVPISVQGWVSSFNDVSRWSQPDSSWTWATIAANPAAGDPNYKVFRTNQANLAVQIGSDKIIYIEGSNEADPRWQAILAGQWDAAGQSPNTQVLKLVDLQPSESTEVDGLRLQRLENIVPISDNNEYQFYVYVT